METNMNFKRVDINEFTLEEAKETLKSKANFEVFGNATQAWKNAGSPAQNTREFKEFCANYLAQKTKNKQGLCCVIIYEPGKADTRERPYQIDNVVNDKGKRKYKTAEPVCQFKWTKKWNKGCFLLDFSQLFAPKYNRWSMMGG